jgi:hypothetical protein
MKKVPTIMFHTVGLQDHKWVFPWISESVEYFESVVSYLSKKGSKSHFFSSDVYEKPQNGNNIVLTFDDGYLDNFLLIYPTLQKHGMKGTIFVNSDFAVREDVVRKKEDGIAGFLSFAEMRELEKSGVMEIQAHSKTHTWYFSGNKIIDYWRPGIATEIGGAVWMLWNKFPEFKPYYLTKSEDYEKKIPYGTPIYEHAKSLVCKRYFNDENLDKVLAEHVENNGGKEFFQKENWKKELTDLSEKYKSENKLNDRYETDEEKKKRIYDELKTSKEVLEKELNKEVNCLCWPGGGVDEEVFEIAIEIGFKRFTRPSVWKENPDPKFAAMIPRTGSSSKINFKGKYLGEKSNIEFYAAIKILEGSWFYKQLNRTFLVLRLLKYFIAG